MSKNKINIIWFIIIITFLFSCQKKKRKYYENGQLHREYYVNKDGIINGQYFEYYKTGKIKLEEKYSNGILIDSSIFYLESGNIIQMKIPMGADVFLCKTYNKNTQDLEFEGYICNDRKFGKWSYFDHKGSVRKIFKYIDYCGVDYMNESWFYDNGGNLIIEKSNFIEIKNLKKAYMTNESVNIKFIYYPYLHKNSESFLCISPNIDSNFCNVNQISLDSVFSNNNQFDFNVRFNKKGIKNLRGFVHELYYDKHINKTIERKVYFDLLLKVE